MLESLKKIFKADSKNYIFIYTAPKVGSTTLVSSLRVSLGISYNILHIHDDTMLNVLTGINDITINEIINCLSLQRKNIWVIDVYRSPIERKISEFFEKISPYHFNNSEENINNYTIKRISNRFNNLFPHLALGDHYVDKYGLTEPIKFDFDKKYTIQHENNINYIKLRLCDSKSWSSILSEVFGKEIYIINDYQGENKYTGDLYKKFKEEYKLPSNYLDLIKNCKYFNYYYSEEERNIYLNEWKTKLDEPWKPYTQDEYKLYVNIYLENQYISDIQINHYIDNGCFCNLCCKKRRELLEKARVGETVFERIVHNEVVNKEFDNRRNKLINFVNVINEKNKTQNKKFNRNQFAINIK
jgi:hypothetical protein